MSTPRLTQLLARFNERAATHYAEPTAWIVQWWEYVDPKMPWTQRVNTRLFVDEASAALWVARNLGPETTLKFDVWEQRYTK